jgi:hypothetical protein
LLNPAAPGYAFRADATASLAAVFDRYVSLCEADVRCRRAYPDLRRAYKDVYRSYSANPRLARSSGGLHLPGVRNDVPAFLDGPRVAQALAAVFEGGPDGLPLLASGIERPSDELNAVLARSEQYPLLLPGFPWGGFLSRICNDSATERRISADASQRTLPEFAGYDDPTLGWMCSAWRVPAVPRSEWSVPTAVPTFVTRQDLAPRQSPYALDAIRTANPTVRVFELRVPTPGGVLGEFPDCYRDLRGQFERDPTRPLDTAACERHESRIPFVTPAG